MPLYEYVCGKCGAGFEMLVRSDTVIACPECGSKSVEKRFSTFAPRNGRSGDFPCGDAPCCGDDTCPSGGCPLGG